MKVDWVTIQERDVVLGADKKQWTITKRAPDGHVWMKRDDGAVYDGKPSGAIELVQKASRAMDEAVSVIDHVFGGVAVSREMPDGRLVCPIDYTSPATLHAHLRVFHNVLIPADERDLAGLTRVHTNIHVHEENAGPYQAHIHDEEWQVAT